MSLPGLLRREHKENGRGYDRQDNIYDSSPKDLAARNGLCKPNFMCKIGRQGLVLQRKLCSNSSIGITHSCGLSDAKDAALSGAKFRLRKSTTSIEFSKEGKFRRQGLLDRCPSEHHLALPRAFSRRRIQLMCP